MGERMQTGGDGAGARRGAAQDVAAGSVIDDRYVIEAEIGRGGMGRVFAATDSKLGRRVAIKLLAGGTRTPEQLRRFASEARAAAALHQQNVVEIYDVGEHAGEPYITSELLSGMTLRQRLDRGAMDAIEASRVALQLARALVAAHAKGIVHRDLKPENVFLDDEGIAKVLDFGIAKLMRADDSAEDRDAIVGTVGYMAPEQVRGGEVDHRSDLFSFGAILYEMLSGRRAFQGGSRLETGFAIVARAPAPLPSHLPRALVRIVERCLEKDREARFQSAGDLVAQLETFVASLAEPRGRLRRFAPWAVALIAAALGAILGRHALSLYGRPGTLLAVLPFRDVGGDPAQAAFTSGLTEILTNKLRQASDVQGGVPVVSATEVWKESVASARAARETFGATLALTGSVQRSGENTVVTLDLVDTQSQTSVGARDVEVPRNDLPRLAAVSAQRAIELLQVHLQPAAQRALEEPGSRSPVAYEFYLQGRGYLQRYDRRENVENALRVFDRALAIDPAYGLAHAGRAEAGLRLFQIAHDPVFLSEAVRSASRAVELSGDSAPVHITLGLVEGARGQRDRAIQSFEHALRLEPRNVEALRELANAYDASGRLDDAEAAYRRAVDLHQNSWAAYKALGVFYNRHDRVAEAARCFERVVELTPDSYAAYSNLGGIYLRMGRTADAEKALRRSLELRPTAQAYANLGWLEYQRGRYADASDLYRKAAELTPADDRYWGALGDNRRWMGASRPEIEDAYRRALEAVEAQLAVDAANPQLRSRRALYLGGLGRIQEGLKEIDVAVRAAPRDGLLRFRAATLREQAGDRDGALTEAQAAFAAGFALAELQAAPPLKSLRDDPRWASLVTAAQRK